MALSNADLENRWVDLWNNLYDLRDSLNGPKVFLIDWKRVSEDELKGWLQDTVYNGDVPKLEKAWYNGVEVIRGHLPKKKQESNKSEMAR